MVFCSSQLGTAALWQSASVDLAATTDRNRCRTDLGVAASGWLLPLNLQSSNDGCDQEQTVKNIAAQCSGLQELT